jgi:hypothetical protein
MPNSMATETPKRLSPARRKCVVSQIIAAIIFLIGSVMGPGTVSNPVPDSRIVGMLLQAIGLGSLIVAAMAYWVIGPEEDE